MSTEIAKGDELLEITKEMPRREVKEEDKLMLNKMPSTKSSEKEQWQQFGEKTSVFITDLQNSVGDFFKNYQPLLGNLGWILLALISAKLMLALLEAINDIPLLSLILELIGIGYVIWFIFRYLLTSASRQKLSGELQNFKKQVFDTES